MSGTPSPPRLMPERPLPPYAYVTGKFPHPTSDPAGHSFGHQPPTSAPLEPDAWRDSVEYLYGFDLFNHGFYWEAHEAWESLWQACGRQGATADLLKGLIKLAAAGVKAREGRAAGVERHAARAIELFEQVRQAQGELFLGLDLARLIDMADRIARFRRVSDANQAVEILFDEPLLPR